MIEIPVLDTTGKQVGTEQLDPERFGGRVRHELLKQAVVAHRANLRQGTVATKSRNMVQGSSRKLYKQKGTGRARMGNIRTPVRVGGGHAFAKVNRDFTQKLPKKMKRLARDSAILAKAIAGGAKIVRGIEFGEPKTKKLAGILKATQVDSGAILAVASPDPNLLLSGRNIPSFAMKLVNELSAFDVLRARNLVFTPEAFKLLTTDAARAAQTA